MRVNASNFASGFALLATVLTGLCLFSAPGFAAENCSTALELVVGVRFKTVERMPDPVVPGGSRLVAELINSKKWNAEGYGFYDDIKSFPALALQLGIGILPPVPGSPASLPNARGGWENGYRFYYPDVIALNGRVKRGIRYESVDGQLNELDTLSLHAKGKIPYSSSGSTHYHDLQIHLFGTLALPEFWWRGIQERAAFLVTLARNEKIMADPVVADAINQIIFSAGWNIEHVTSSFKNGIVGTLPGLRAPSTRLERAEALKEKLMDGGTGLDLPQKGTKSLSQMIFSHIRSKKGPTYQSPSTAELNQVFSGMTLTEDPIFPDAIKILEEAESNVLLNPPS